MRIAFFSATLFLTLPFALPQPAAGEGVAGQVRQAEKAVAAVRGLPFKHDVPETSITSVRLRQVLEEKLQEGLPVPLETYFRTLAAIGALSAADLPGLKERLLSFYESQVVAFYDPETGKFYVSDGALQKLNASGDMTSASMEREMVFTHELTHALQDQYMDLEPRLQALKNNSDQGLAFDCLLEGEATEVMIENALKDLPVSSQDVEDALDPLLTSSLADLDPSTSSIPDFFKQQLFFPYTAGTAYIRTLKKRGGWGAVNEVWRNPPNSSATILHGKLDWAPDDDLLPAGGALAPPAGATFLYTDTLGEWALRFLFQRHSDTGGDAVAAAWRGDRFAFFELKGRVVYAGVIKARDGEAARHLRDAWKTVNPDAQGTVRGERVVVWTGYARAPF